MDGFDGHNLPPPTDWQKLERLCRDLWAEIWADPNTLANGRLGQSQNGVDVYGIPTISIPCGYTSAGLPIGLQIAGAPWAEPSIFALAHAYEQATQWHTRHPKLG